jgi:hypothetical protein
MASDTTARLLWEPSPGATSQARQNDYYFGEALIDSSFPVSWLLKVSLYYQAADSSAGRVRLRRGYSAGSLAVKDTPRQF